MPYIVLNTGDKTVNKRDKILVLVIYSLRKDFIYYRLDASPISIN